MPLNEQDTRSNSSLLQAPEIGITHMHTRLYIPENGERLEFLRMLYQLLLTGEMPWKHKKDGNYGPTGFGKDIVTQADPGSSLQPPSRHVHQRD